MESIDWLAFGDFLQSLTVLISLGAYLPQWFIIYRRKSSENVSLHAWLIWSISSSFTLFYACIQYKTYGTARALLFSSCMGFVFILATIILILRYRARSAITQENDTRTILTTPHH